MINSITTRTSRSSQPANITNNVVLSEFLELHIPNIQQLVGMIPADEAGKQIGKYLKEKDITHCLDVISITKRVGLIGGDLSMTDQQAKQMGGLLVGLNYYEDNIVSMNGFIGECGLSKKSPAAIVTFFKSAGLNNTVAAQLLFLTLQKDNKDLSESQMGDVLQVNAPQQDIYLQIFKFTKNSANFSKLIATFYPQFNIENYLAFILKKMSDDSLANLSVSVDYFAQVLAFARKTPQYTTEKSAEAITSYFTNSGFYVDFNLFAAAGIKDVEIYCQVIKSVAIESNKEKVYSKNDAVLLNFKLPFICRVLKALNRDKIDEVVNFFKTNSQLAYMKVSISGLITIADEMNFKPLELITKYHDLSGVNIPNYGDRRGYGEYLFAIINKENPRSHRDYYDRNYYLNCGRICKLLDQQPETVKFNWTDHFLELEKKIIQEADSKAKSIRVIVPADARKYILEGYGVDDLQQIIKLPNLPKTSLELSKAILAYGIKISVKSWLDYCDTNQINPSAHIASWLPNLKLDFAGVVQLLNRGVTEQQIYEYQRKNKNDFIDMPDEKNKLAQLIKDGQTDAKHIAVLTRLFVGAGAEQIAKFISDFKLNAANIGKFIKEANLSSREIILAQLINDNKITNDELVGGFQQGHFKKFNFVELVAFTKKLNLKEPQFITKLMTGNLPNTFSNVTVSKVQCFANLKDFVSQTQISEPETLGKLINSLALSGYCNQNAKAVIDVIRSTKMPKTAADLASFVNHLKITNVDVISQIVKECLDIKNPIENNSDLLAGAVTEFIGNTNIPRATDGLVPFIARSFVDDDNLNSFIDGIGVANGQKEKLRNEIATMQHGSVENNQTNNMHNEISTHRRQPNVYDAITDKDL